MTLGASKPYTCIQITARSYKVAPWLLLWLLQNTALAVPTPTLYSVYSRVSLAVYYFHSALIMEPQRGIVSLMSSLSLYSLINAARAACLCYSKDLHALISVVVFLVFPGW